MGNFEESARDLLLSILDTVDIPYQCFPPTIPERERAAVVATARYMLSERRERDRFCPRCGKKTVVAAGARPFFDPSTGEPHFYATDQICPEHGSIYPEL